MSERKPRPLNLQSMSDLVELIRERDVNRQLNRLGDEGLTIAIEAAAIKKGDKDAIKAVRLLRGHILTTGSAEGFSEAYPEQNGVDLMSLLDGVDFGDDGFQTAFWNILPGVEERSLALPMRKEEIPSIESPKELTAEQSLRLEELEEIYPPVKTLFDDEGQWSEKPGGEFIRSDELFKLLVKRDLKKPSRRMRMEATQAVMEAFEARNPGREIRVTFKGENNALFTERGDAVDLLWFFHNHLDEARLSWGIAKGAALPKVSPKESVLPLGLPSNAEQILSDKYPKIKLLLEDDSLWTEGSMGDEELYLPRTLFRTLIRKRDDGSEASKVEATTLFSTYLKKVWEEHFREEVPGKRIEGQGIAKFYTREEAIQILWIFHAKLGTEGFYQSLELDSSDIDPEEFKKKLLS
jgi:hypothetical protein